MKRSQLRAMYSKREHPRGKFPIYDVHRDVTKNQGKHTLKNLYSRHPTWAVDNLIDRNFIVHNTKNRMVTN